MSIMSSLINFEKLRCNHTSESNAIEIFPMSDTSLNKWVPFAAGFTGQVFNNGLGDKVMTYNLWKSPRNGGESIRYANVYNALRNFHYPYLFTTGGNTYHACKGCIYEVKDGVTTVLMCLSLETDYFWEMDRNNIDYSRFAVFISNAFLDPRHIVFYKRIHTDFIDLYRQLGIDITYTMDIETKCFNTPPILRFNTVTEMKAHLEEINNLALYA